MEASNFLFTWSPRVWPYEKLRALIDDFEAGRDAVEGWTCAAYPSIKKGDRAYVLKQGRGPCGVFGIAVVDGPAWKSPDPRPGGGKYYVPLKFETLLDPTNGFLITKDGLLRLGAAASLLNTQKSGVTLKPAAIASVIDEIADKEGLTLDDFVQRMNAAKVRAAASQDPNASSWRTQPCVEQSDGSMPKGSSSRMCRQSRAATFEPDLVL